MDLNWESILTKVALFYLCGIIIIVLFFLPKLLLQVSRRHIYAPPSLLEKTGIWIIYLIVLLCSSFIFELLWEEHLPEHSDIIYYNGMIRIFLCISPSSFFGMLRALDYENKVTSQQKTKFNRDLDNAPNPEW